MVSVFYVLISVVDSYIEKSLILNADKLYEYIKIAQSYSVTYIFFYIPTTKYKYGILSFLCALVMHEFFHLVHSWYDCKGIAIVTVVLYN